MVGIAALLMLAVLVQTSEAKTHDVLKARVRFLATGSIIRTTWGSNRDEYLVEVTATPEGESVLARMIDDYASYQPPLSFAVLTSQAGSALTIRRDPRCEMPYATMQLRTAPGDPLAIVHERLGYKPELTSTPRQGVMLPCYRPERPRGGF
jgi:hypothetical protein